MPSVNLARGMRDFLPAAMRRRRWVVEQVERVFESFGFEPLETPAMERIETLTGKYGEEGDRLLFKVLKRGEGGRRGEADMGLRYDLTVPLARVVAMNQDLPMPFRRHQVQPVWRADRPQRGRYREFLQCDVDVVGIASPVADAECVAVVNASLAALGFRSFTVRLNHRALLRNLAMAMGVPAMETQVLVALDKLDKVGRDGVEKELGDRGVPEEARAIFWRFLDALSSGAPMADLPRALGELAGEEGLGALQELERIMDLAESMGVPRERMRFDPTLARGLDYYTGAVFETVVDKPVMGSLSGGGRYDKLIGMFLGRDLPAVGVSLGLERILVVMEELEMFPELPAGIQILVAALGQEELAPALAAARVFRAHGMNVVVSPEPMRFKKALRQAQQRGIPMVALVGEEEAAEGKVTLKRLSDGTQWKGKPENLVPQSV